MGNNTTASLKNVEWMWQSNPNPWSKTEEAVWSHYSDVENIIIEEAYNNKKSRATLDEYFVDFEQQMQVSIADTNRQRPIKRIERKREDKHLREQRFFDLPTSNGRSFGGQYGWVSPFIVEVRRALGLGDGRLPSKNPEIVDEIVQKAARGIIEEAKGLKKEQEGKKLAEKLLEMKGKGMKEVWKRCAYLYSLESFLYKSMNATLRLIGNKEDEKIWLSKVNTLGHFCLLLWDDPFNEKLTIDKTLYRGATLTDEQIEKYKEMAKNHEEYGSFQSFSSCSRNREKAEAFGNTLFIMKVLYAFIADLSPLSEYQNEEEELITPGVCFRVERVKFDSENNKHIIHLELRQMFNPSSIEELPTYRAGQPDDKFLLTNDNLRYFNFNDDFNDNFLHDLRYNLHLYFHNADADLGYDRDGDRIKK